MIVGLVLLAFVGFETAGVDVDVGSDVYGHDAEVEFDASSLSSSHYFDFDDGDVSVHCRCDFDVSGDVALSAERASCDCLTIP